MENERENKIKPINDVASEFKRAADEFKRDGEEFKRL